ncbi:MAG TPA: hypothetical protein EYP30_05655 [Archaeoglobaceae archaeon]|nr:hypothetical protein [Archaeoglobaceae archaeon]
MMAAIPEEIMSVLRVYLMERRRILEAICRKFEEMYGNFEQFEKRVEKDGVPEDDHTIWDNLIEWENALDELKKIKSILEGLG